MNSSTPPPDAAQDLAEILTWAWVLGLSFLGGYVSFMRKLRAGHARAWNFAEFIGEIVTSGLVGLITANLCMWLLYPKPLTYALVGISSHMGSRALFKLEKLFDAKFPVAKETPDDAH